MKSLTSINYLILKKKPKISIALKQALLLSIMRYLGGASFAIFKNKNTDLKGFVMSTDSLGNSDTSMKSTAYFPPANWKYIFKLLSLVILADKRVFKEEIDAFRDGVSELQAIIDPSIHLTDKMVLDWFVLNKPALEEVLDSLSYDTALCEILGPIKSIPHKLDVISCMVRIAVSDNDYSDVEKLLIKKTCLYWNVRSTFQQNLEFLHTPGNKNNAFYEELASRISWGR